MNRQRTRDVGDLGADNTQSWSGVLIRRENAIDEERSRRRSSLTQTDIVCYRQRGRSVEREHPGARRGLRGGDVRGRCGGERTGLRHTTLQSNLPTVTRAKLFHAHTAARRTAKNLVGLCVDLRFQFRTGELRGARLGVRGVTLIEYGIRSSRPGKDAGRESIAIFGRQLRHCASPVKRP